MNATVNDGLSRLDSTVVDDINTVYFRSRANGQSCLIGNDCASGNCISGKCSQSNKCISSTNNGIPWWGWILIIIGIIIIVVFILYFMYFAWNPPNDVIITQNEYL